LVLFNFKSNGGAGEQRHNLRACSQVMLSAPPACCLALMRRVTSGCSTLRPRCLGKRSVRGNGWR